MLQVLLAYAHADGEAAAARLRAELLQAVFGVWRDREELRGEGSWKEQLRSALQRVDVVLVLLTPGAVASANVRWEWEEALALQKSVLPLLMLTCEVPADLQRQQYPDFRTAEAYSLELARLVSDLRAIAPPSTASSGPAAAEPVPIAPGFQPSWQVTGSTIYIHNPPSYSPQPELPDRGAGKVNPPPETPHNLPFSGATQFVGRDREMAQLYEQLQQGNRVAITAIQGMGGIGKTELALQYADYHRQQGTYRGGIGWFRVRGVEVGTQIVTFAKEYLGLTVPDELQDLRRQVSFCWGRWRAGNVLAVFDDVNDYQEIAPYLPPADSRFSVLLTTRVQLGASVRQLSLDMLSEEAALELLRSLVGSERVDRQLAEAKHLCQWLGYLPLGLELVGRYLARKPIGLWLRYSRNSKTSN